jgi:hypothetical protein
MPGHKKMYNGDGVVDNRDDSNRPFCTKRYSRVRSSSRIVQVSAGSIQRILPCDVDSWLRIGEPLPYCLFMRFAATDLETFPWALS